MAESFTVALKTWTPANTNGEPDKAAQWTFNDDGSVSITLPGWLAANLGDELADWDHWGGSWVDRPDCQNWKRSAIARENRRETITYSNALGSIKALLGRREINALIARCKELQEKAGTE